MRKVMVSKYERDVSTPGDSFPHLRPWVKVDRGEAVFHCFGLDYVENDSDKGNFYFSVAIVEWPDGTLEGVPIHAVRFLTPPQGVE